MFPKCFERKSQVQEAAHESIPPRPFNKHLQTLLKDICKQSRELTVLQAKERTHQIGACFSPRDSLFQLRSTWDIQACQHRGGIAEPSLKVSL